MPVRKKMTKLVRLISIGLVVAVISLFMPVQRVTIEGIGKFSVGQQVAYASPDWYDPSWGYRRAITLSPATSVDDYQVLVTLDTATMGDPYANVNADGSDIRFTGSDEVTLQDYWIESWDNNGTSKIWVEVKTSATSTIYMYYGNAAAGSASDATATFLFYDDFEDETLGNPPTGWTVHTGCTGILVQDDAGNKVLDDGTGSGGNVIAGDPSWTDVAVRQKVRSVDDVVYHAGVVIRYTDEGNEVYGGITGDTCAQIWNRVGGTWYNIGQAYDATDPSGDDCWTIPDVGTSWHVQEVRIAGNTVELYIDDNYIGNGTLTSGAPTSGASGFWCQYSQQGYRDEHIVRKYTSSEPGASVGSEESCPVTIDITAPADIADWNLTPLGTQPLEQTGTLTVTCTGSSWTVTATDEDTTNTNGQMTKYDGASYDTGTKLATAMEVKADDGTNATGSEVTLLTGGTILTGTGAVTSGSYTIHFKQTVLWTDPVVTDPDCYRIVVTFTGSTP